MCACVFGYAPQRLQETFISGLLDIHFFFYLCIENQIDSLTAATGSFAFIPVDKCYRSIEEAEGQCNFLIINWLSNKQLTLPIAYLNPNSLNSSKTVEQLNSITSPPINQESLFRSFNELQVISLNIKQSQQTPRCISSIFDSRVNWITPTQQISRLWDHSTMRR